MCYEGRRLVVKQKEIEGDFCLYKEIIGGAMKDIGNIMHLSIQFELDCLYNHEDECMPLWDLNV